MYISLGLIYGQKLQYSKQRRILLESARCHRADYEWVVELIACANKNVALIAWISLGSVHRLTKWQSNVRIFVRFRIKRRSFRKIPERKRHARTTVLAGNGYDRGVSPFGPLSLFFSPRGTSIIGPRRCGTATGSIES